MNSHKVKLVGPNGIITFEASSPLSEERQASYQGFNIVHLPTTLHAYQNTSGRRFNIAGKLVSRTPSEAVANARYLDLARNWVLPSFGGTGATPPILKLSGYNNNHIKNTQVVLTSYSWQFPDDVDFIWAAGIPMPVIGNISISLEEAYSAEQITGRKWELKPSGGGSFNRKSDSPGGGGSFSITERGSKSGASGSAGRALGGILQAAGALSPQAGGGFIPGAPGSNLGRLTRNLGSQVATSLELVQLVGQLPNLSANSFVSGAKALLVDQAAGLAGAALGSINPLLGGFGREAVSAITKVVGIDD